jgi:hypothetical protein
MRELLGTGRILDLVLGLVVVEVLVILGLQAGRFRPRIPPHLVAHLLAAAGLLSAAHMALAGAGWLFVGFFLLCALAAHLQALGLWMILAPSRATGLSQPRA